MYGLWARNVAAILTTGCMFESVAPTRQVLPLRWLCWSDSIFLSNPLSSDMQPLAAHSSSGHNLTCRPHGTRKHRDSTHLSAKK